MKQLKTMYHAASGRLRSYGLLVLIMLSVVTSVGLQFVNPQTALAASGVFASGPLTKNITDYALRNAVASCEVKDSRSGGIDATDIASGNWFNTSKEVGVTHLYASDDGKRECKTASLVNDARAAGGWGSNIEMACAAGYHRLNNSNCVNGTGKMFPPDNSGTRYIQAFDAKRKIAFSGPMYYLLYARSMEIGCKATPVIEFDKASPDQKALANSDKGWSMKVVGADGKVTNTIYKAELGRGRKITTTETPNSHSTQQVSCIDLVKRANQYADSYAAYVRANPNEAGTTTPGGDEGATSDDAGKTSCVIDGIGWIICPVVRFMSMVTDGSYNAVAMFLKTPAVDTDTGEPMYIAWSMMRNIANVAFVIAFLIIIYSQVTSVGMSNYGVKKLLPRLIVAAVLVNISYWICAIAVDLSNITGYALKDLLDGVSTSLFVEGGTASSGAGGKWDLLTTSVIAGGAAVALLYVELSVLVPLVVAALITIIIVVILLVIRQAFIIMLIVISPLAFVAYLLPNTASLFTKWRKLFVALLMLFPIVAFIFGGSALAGTVITGAGGGDFFMQAMGAGVTIVPLIAVPLFLKGTSALFGKLGGMVNNPNRGVFDRSRKAADAFRERKHTDARLRALNPAKRSMLGKTTALEFGARRRATAAGRSKQLEDMEKESIARMATTSDGRPTDFARKVAGDKADIYAAQQAQYLTNIDPAKLKLEVDEASVKNALTQLKLSVTDPSQAIEIYKKQLEDAVAKGDDGIIDARAAQQALMGAGKKGRSELRKALQGVDAASNVGMELRKDIQGSDMKANAADVYAWAVGATKRNEDGTLTQNKSLNQVAAEKSTWSGLSAAQVQGQVGTSLEAARSAGGISKEAARSALDLRGNESIGQDERKIIEDIAK